MSFFTDLGAARNKLPFSRRGNVLTVYFYRNIEQKLNKDAPEHTVVFVRNIHQCLRYYRNRLAYSILMDPTNRWKTARDGTHYKTHILTEEELARLEDGEA